jgi:hypothetical protein
MPVHHGRCHCGAIHLDVELDCLPFAEAPGAGQTIVNLRCLDGADVEALPAPRRFAARALP